MQAKLKINVMYSTLTKVQHYNTCENATVFVFWIDLKKIILIFVLSEFTFVDTTHLCQFRIACIEHRGSLDRPSTNRNVKQHIQTTGVW